MNVGIDKIMEYEQGEMDEAATISFFADLVKCGLAWSLQGSYGRTAKQLIEAGRITPDGRVATAADAAEME